MSTLTPVLGLIKPADADTFGQDDFNTNADTLDLAPGIRSYTTAQRNALTAAQRPPGRTIFNSTTGTLEVNTGTAAVPVWAAVGGGGGEELGYAETTTDQLGIATGGVDLTGLAVTVPCDGVSPIEIMGYVLGENNTSASKWALLINESATQLQQSNIATDADQAETNIVICRIIPTAGDHTYKLRVVSNVTTVDVQAATGRPNFIRVTEYAA